MFIIRPLRRFSTFNPAKDYYKILKVEQTATQDAIKASFKALAKRYHPDFNQGKEEQFKEINEAYQVLSDQKTKFQYDQTRTGAQTQQQHPFSRERQNYPGNHPYSQPNQAQQFYYDHRGPNGFHRHEQELHQYFRQQQEFFSRFQRAQREKFERRGQSPLENEYMRRFMEEVMAQEEARRAAEQLRAEMQEAERMRREEERLQKERLQKELEENARKLKDMGRRVVQDVKDFAKQAWNIFKDFKGKK